IGHGPRGWDLEALVGLTQRVPSGRRGERHLEEEYLDLARAAGGETGAARRLRVAPEAEAEAEDLLSDLGDFLALAPRPPFPPAAGERATGAASAGRPIASPKWRAPGSGGPWFWSARPRTRPRPRRSRRSCMAQSSISRERPIFPHSRPCSSERPSWSRTT